MRLRLKPALYFGIYAISILTAMCAGMVSCGTKIQTDIKNIPLHLISHKGDSVSSLKKIKARGYVLVFMAPECPICQASVPALTLLKDSFMYDSICFMAVYSGKAVTQPEVVQFTNRHPDMVSYWVYDRAQQLQHALKASITPEVFVLDSQYQVIYSGKIDNKAEALGVKRASATEFYLRDALISLLKNEKPHTEHTQAVGCYIE